MMLDTVRFSSGCPHDGDSSGTSLHQRRQIYLNMGMSPCMLNSWVQHLDFLEQRLSGKVIDPQSRPPAYFLPRAMMILGVSWDLFSHNDDLTARIFSRDSPFLKTVLNLADAQDKPDGIAAIRASWDAITTAISSHPYNARLESRRSGEPLHPASSDELVQELFHFLTWSQPDFRTRGGRDAKWFPLVCCRVGCPVGQTESALERSYRFQVRKEKINPDGADDDEQMLVNLDIPNPITPRPWDLLPH
ncbi:hypothetical protein M427DRAFT_69010 [Gonapodya prolifera JEL478]|uniref:Uncharacterized protein n=1 Tax=Gonapodya prolifera (strain JEL478) TaxID=1344416 RepID=A0A139AIM8_GONPJ|nr:hypothetical protein M427DRAFT_69010 [Gonapodya prolifera JEL478]|eukprot:KXS16404.1 hypothetical protein M427DRAFT_69010 [Gonapodya prolifera JEL478]